MNSQKSHPQTIPIKLDEKPARSAASPAKVLRRDIPTGLRGSRGPARRAPEEAVERHPGDDLAGGRARRAGQGSEGSRQRRGLARQGRGGHVRQPQEEYAGRDRRLREEGQASRALELSVSGHDSRQRDYFFFARVQCWNLR